MSGEECSADRWIVQALPVLDSLAEGIVVLDARGVVRAANRAFEEIAGADRSSFVGRPSRTGLDCRTLDGRPSRSGLSPLVGATRDGRTLDLVRPDGSRRRIEVQYRPVDPGVGEDGLTVATVRDVTHEDELHRWLSRTRSAQGLARLTGHVLPQLRHPLHGIDLHVQILERILGQTQGNLRDDEAFRLVRKVHDEIRRLAGTLDELAAASRVTPSRRAPVDLGSLLRELMSFLAPRAAARGLRLHCDVADDLPAPRLDPDEVRDGLLELLLEAMEAASEGSTLRVLACARGSRVELVVSATRPRTGARERRPGGPASGERGLATALAVGLGGSLRVERTEEGESDELVVSLPLG